MKNSPYLDRPLRDRAAVEREHANALAAWRAARMSEMENRYDVLPQGMREFINRDTPDAMEARMKDNER